MNNNRLLSLDVMRGITIAGMILVNNAGDWNYVYAPLRHAHWDGFTPTDMVFPFFMFMMGISAYFSLRKYNFKWSRASLIKIVKRTVLIFLIGMFINLFGLVLNQGFDWEHWRILGVLQRLALAYGFGSLIALSINHKYLLHTAALLLLAYAGIVVGTNSLAMSPDSILAVIDRAVVGEPHMYRDVMDNGTNIAFEPEGILSLMSSIAHVLIGMFVGKMILANKNKPEAIVRNLFVLGTILLFTGLLFSYGVPVNKKIWSSTFVLVTCGFGSQLLALLMYMIDIRKKKKWTAFFEAFGINPLYLYVQSEILGMAFSACGLCSTVMDNVLTPIFGNYLASLVWALLFVALNFIPGYYLYKKQVYIKI